MRHICLITVLFISAICCAESKFNEYYSANPDSNQLYHIRYQNVVVSDLNNIKIDTFYYDENYYSKIDATEIAWINNVPYIVSIPGGMVWKLINDTFTRIDNSYHHKMTCGSDVFVHNDTIFKFGGYGYWSNRNFFTYFDFKTTQWEFYKINNTYLPKGISHFNSTYFDENYYFSGGVTINYFDATIHEQNPDVWRFNFKNKTWVNLGISKHIDFHKKNTLDIGNGCILHEDDDDDIYLVDYVNNLIKKNNKKSIGPLNNAIHINDSIYLNFDSRLVSFPINDFKTNASFEKKFFLDSNALFSRLWVLSISLIIIIIILVSFLQIRNRNKPKITNRGIKYAGTNYNLTDRELKVLNALIKYKNIDSKTILMNIYDYSLSEPQNNRIKLDVIKNLDSKLCHILDVESFIESKKSTKDKRLVIYYSKQRKNFLK
tara:strand:+ start:1103 stop:2398 length:1296 start_codon:yes stop_codon:yes gene_type:complete